MKTAASHWTMKLSKELAIRMIAVAIAFAMALIPGGGKDFLHARGSSPGFGDMFTGSW